MSKYRIRRSGPKNIILEVWKDAGINQKGKPFEAHWAHYGFYGNMWHNVVIAAINLELVPVGEELREQLENMPQALEDAAKRVLAELKIEELR